MPSGGRFAEASFQALDYVILVLMLVVSLGIGMFYAFRGRKETSAKEYFTASGSIGLIPATFSLLASVLCSIWYIGYPAEVYQFGFHFIFDVPLLPTALAMVAYGFLPVFYELGVTSANEYLEKRFNSAMRLCGSFLYICNSALYVALVMFIPALSVSQVTGMHLWVSITVMCMVGTIYTALGGIRAVMWTDVFQMLIIYASMFAVAIKGTIDVGGFFNVINKAVEGNRISLAPFSLDPRFRYNLLGMIVICQFYWLGYYGTYQTQIQRYLSCPSQKSAQKAIWWNMLAFWVVESMIVYTGLILYANYADCDPKLSNRITTSDEILTYYVMKSFKDYPGLSGLFISGVFSGALSTISSCLNSMAAVTLEDFILAIPKFRHMKDKTKTSVSRWLAAMYGLITIGLMAVVELIDSVITFWGYNNGMVMGCNMGLFVLGLFCPWANSTGAFIGLAVSGVFGLLAAAGGQIVGVTYNHEILSISGCEAQGVNVSLISVPSCTNGTRLYSIMEDRGGFKELFAISPFFLQPFTFLILLVVGAVASAVFGSDKKVDEKLLSPLIRPLLKAYQRLPRRTAETEYEKDKAVPFLKDKELNLFS